MRKFDLKVWEKALVALSMILFSASFFLYATDFPLRKYLFNLQDEGGQQKVGRVATRNGSLRRQILGESEFKGIDTAADLFNGDTVVTGTEGSATLALDDGSVIELGPSTMVRLTFETHLTLGGISRAASVDVVAGAVTGQAKSHAIVIRAKERVVDIPRETQQTVRIAPPVPTPVPLPSAIVAAKPKPVPTVNPDALDGVTLIAPKDGDRFAVGKGAERPEKAIDFQWKVNPPDRRVLVTLYQVVPKSPEAPDGRKEVYHDVVVDQSGKGKGTGSVNWVIQSPGQYEWELKGPQGERIPARPRSRLGFYVEPEFEAIQPLDPLVGGMKAETNLMAGAKQRRDFDITLRWKPYPGAEKYQVILSKSPKAETALLQRSVDEAQYSFNKNKVITGKMYYKVATTLPSGFVATSGTQMFLFNFLPPLLSVPPDRSVVTRDALESEGNSILLTWQKTNFTDSYEIEIGKDPGFRNLMSKARQKENFYVFKSPGVGSYWWRVRSKSKNVVSSPSRAFELTIAP